MSKKTGEKAKKAKKAKKGADSAPAADAIHLGAHPAARQSIRRARAWAGAGGFALILLLALRAGVPQFEAVLRALAGGLMLHFATWAFAIALWRRLVLAELEAAHERIRSAASPSA